ncbi:MAG: AAA family ATPase [Sphingomonas oligoaromativorans]
MAATSDPVHHPAGSDVVAFLQHAAFGEAHRIDTHAAHVFLAKDRAWKMKQPVNLGFLDFSTPDKRRAALEAELALNRRTAPDLYLSLHPVVRDSHGSLQIDGEGETVDWLLEMRRFPDEALFDRLAKRDKLDPPLLVRLADIIAAFHERSEVSRHPTPERDLKAVIEGNAERFAQVASMLPKAQCRSLTERQRALLAAHRDRLATRANRGRVRHVHGDLHLRNIALIDGIPILFDCLEFDPALATIDVAYDLAFLLMDLWHRRLRNEANMVFNRYLDVSAEDEDCASLMPFFVSLRAAIRAHVLATQALQADEHATSEALAYLDLAIGVLKPVSPCIVAVGGLSGTGKSTLARALGGLIGAPPGARILRSDVLRKRAAGLKPEDRLPPSSYTPEAAQASYQRLFEFAVSHLKDGTSVVIDAAFAEANQRQAVTALAARLRLPFHGLWLEASVATRIARVRDRSKDASDADEAVARQQLDVTLGNDEPWHVLPADDAPEAVAAQARAMIRSALS